MKYLEIPAQPPYCPFAFTRIARCAKSKCSHPTCSTEKRYHISRQKTRKHSQTRPSVWVVLSHRKKGTMSGTAAASASCSRLGGKVLVRAQFTPDNSDRILSSLPLVKARICAITED
jgi:hypothetical protein